MYSFQLNECGVTDTEIAMMETSQMQSAWKRRRQEDSDCPAWTRPVSHKLRRFDSLKKIIGILYITHHLVERISNILAHRESHTIRIVLSMFNISCSMYEIRSHQDMFYELPMVRSMVGMSILKKLGWQSGQVLGRGCPYGSAFGAGSLAPLELMVKTDQVGAHIITL